MGKTKILYQIKTLEKMIFRRLIQGSEIEKQNLKLEPTPTQMQILEYMMEHSNEDIYQRDLENIVNLRRATVSGVLQTMEKNELIQRITDSADTRAKQIIITERAKKVFLEKKQKLENIEKIIIQDISKEDLETFSKVIEIMKNNINSNQ